MPIQGSISVSVLNAIGIDYWHLNFQLEIHHDCIEKSNGRSAAVDNALYTGICPDVLGAGCLRVSASGPGRVEWWRSHASSQGCQRIREL
jgi:hypothetical protein